MRDHRGFTLLEILIALAIITILSVIGISNFQEWIYQNNASGFRREMLSELQQARIRASSATTRYRLVIDLGDHIATLQTLIGSTWSDARPPVRAPFKSRIASVTPSPGSAVTSGRYAMVFNPSGEVYGQTDIANDNTIAALDNATILLTGASSSDNGSITVFGWTGKSRLN